MVNRGDFFLSSTSKGNDLDRKEPAKPRSSWEVGAALSPRGPDKADGLCILNTVIVAVVIGVIKLCGSWLKKSAGWHWEVIQGSLELRLQERRERAHCKG